MWVQGLKLLKNRTRVIFYVKVYIVIYYINYNCDKILTNTDRKPRHAPPKSVPAFNLNISTQHNGELQNFTQYYRAHVLNVELTANRRKILRCDN